MKKCTLCKKKKPISEFSSNGAKYYKSKCKLCNAKHVNNTRRSNKRDFLRGKWDAIKHRCSSEDENYSYYGKKYPDKKSFIEWSIKRKDFCDLFYEWSRNDYKQKLTPSIDRIDVNGDYEFNNMQFITYGENSAKDKFKKFKLLSPLGIVVEGIGICDFCKKNNLSVSCISNVLNDKRKSHRGWTNANSSSIG